MVILYLRGRFFYRVRARICPQVAFWSPVGGDWIILQTNQLESKMGLEGEPSECLGDTFGPTSTQYRDGEVSQGGHDAWCGSGPYLGAVFAKGLVSYPVETVFNAPMLAVDLKQTLG